MIVSCGEGLVDLVPDPAPGGGPMNVAVAAARLGAPSAFLGRVSTDEHGELIWAHLRDAGVDLRLCERGPEPTARAVVSHTPRLSFRFDGDGTADTRLGVAELDPLGDGPHILHGGTLGFFRGRTAEVLAALVEQHDGLVSLDPNVRPHTIDDAERWHHFHARWLGASDIYRASDEDVEWIWPGRSHDSWAAELIDAGRSVVVVTRGAAGATIFTPEGEVEITGRSVDVVDTVGAGDTFVAAMLVGLWDRGICSPAELTDHLDAADWSEIGSRAVVAAAITCSRPGADPPTAAELGWIRPRTSPPR